MSNANLLTNVNVLVEHISLDPATSVKEGFVIDTGLASVPVNIQPASRELLVLFGGAFGKSYTVFTTYSGILQTDRLTDLSVNNGNTFSLSYDGDVTLTINNIFDPRASVNNPDPTQNGYQINIESLPDNLDSQFVDNVGTLYPFPSVIDLTAFIASLPNYPTEDQNDFTIGLFAESNIDYNDPNTVVVSSIILTIGTPMSIDYTPTKYIVKGTENFNYQLGQHQELFVEEIQ